MIDRKAKMEHRQTRGTATIGGVPKSMDMKGMETRSEPSNSTFDMSPCIGLFANGIWYDSFLLSGYHIIFFVTEMEREGRKPVLTSCVLEEVDEAFNVFVAGDNWHCLHRAHLPSYRSFSFYCFPCPIMPPVLSFFLKVGFSNSTLRTPFKTSGNTEHVYSSEVIDCLIQEGTEHVEFHYSALRLLARLEQKRSWTEPAELKPIWSDSRFENFGSGRSKPG